MVHPASLLGRFAGTKPLVWIGLRSYGIYLWHYPLFLLMNPRNFTGETPWWMYLVQVAVVFACAAFSYRFVENPLRKGAIGAFVKGVRSKEIDPPAWLKHHVVPVLAGSAVTIVAVIGLIVVPPTSAIGAADLLKDEQAHTSQMPELPVDDAAAESPKLDVLMIGDSVSVRAIPQFEETFPYGAIDAAVNRQLYAGQETFDYYNDQDIVGGVVVFALGTNGAATDEQIDELVAAAGPGRQVFFVNTRSPQSWVGQTNGAMFDAVDRHDNVHVIDWYTASAGHDEYFDGDGTHLTEEGARAYIGLVHDAVAPLLPVHAESDEAVVVKSPLELAADNAQKASSDTVRALAANAASNLKPRE